MQTRKIPTTIVAVLSIAMCFTAHWGYQLLSGIAVVFLSMICLLTAKQAHTSYNVFMAVLSFAAAGYVLGMGQPLPIIMMVVIPLRGGLRVFFPRTIGISKLLWIDYLLLFSAVALYFVINVFYPAGWQGWALPVLPISFAAFMGIMGVVDRSAMNKARESGVIRIGSKAPDFCLSDQDGKKISLSDFFDKTHLLIIFVRGDWCPSCHIMLRTYQIDCKKFKNKNMTLLAIGPDPLGVNKALVEKLELEYKLLSDDKQEISRKYSLNTQPNIIGATDFEGGIPLPASFVVDKKGFIRYSSRADKADEILNPSAIFSTIEKLN